LVVSPIKVTICFLLKCIRVFEEKAAKLVPKKQLGSLLLERVSAKDEHLHDGTWYTGSQSQTSVQKKPKN
jgi:hypothetical protein